MKKLIETTYNPLPIPNRKYDWVATMNGYEPGDPIGYGQTENDAVEDLIEHCEKERKAYE